MKDDASRFKSPLAKYMQAYVDEYKVKGLKTAGIRQVLGLFDDFLTANGYSKDYVTQSIFEKWEDSYSDLTYNTKQGRRSLMRGFLYFISQLGHESYIPRRIPFKACAHIPYIYTKDEIAQIFKAADEWRENHHTVTHASMIMPALLRLMYSTGTRIGETLSIRNRDVDFKRHVIYLAFTKNNCDRLVAMNDSVEKAIRQYLKYRDMLPVPNLNDPDKTLFVSCRGVRCQKATIECRFRRILDKIGIPTNARLHDIRHTACVHAMVKLVGNGHDVYCCLPMLSTYMGHKNPRSTEYYLRLTKEYYPDLIELDMKVTSAIKGIISRSILIHEGYGEE